MPIFDKSFKELFSLMKMFPPKGEENDRLTLENKALQNIKLRRELEGFTPAQKFAIEKNIDQQKLIFNKLLELGKDPEINKATRNLYGKMLQNHYFGLSHEMRGVLGPLIAGSPVDPISQKKEWFDKNFKSPAVPAFNPEDPYTFAEALFERQDFDDKRQKFLGVDPGSPRKAIGLGNGMFAIRDSKGQASILSAEDERLQKIAEGYGTTAEAILANGGEWHTGPWSHLQMGDGIMVVRPTKNFITGEDSYQAMPIVGKSREREPGKPRMRRMPDRMQRMFVEIATNSDKSTVAKQFHELVGEEGTEGISRFVDNVLAPSFPEWKFVLASKRTAEGKLIPAEIKRRGLIGLIPFVPNYYIDAENYSFVAWPSVSEIEIEGKRLSYDPEYDAVYDNNGNYIGTYDETLALAQGGK